jgi:hypothetical protein
MVREPYMPWPETPPQRNFEAYAHQLLFVYDRHDALPVAAKEPDLAACVLRSRQIYQPASSIGHER